MGCVKEPGISRQGTDNLYILRSIGDVVLYLVLLDLYYKYKPLPSFEVILYPG